MRLLPRSLGGQLVLLLVAALVLAQVLAFALFALERGAAYRAAYRDNAAARLVSLVRLMEDSPTELQSRIAATASSPLLRITLGPAPETEADDGPDAGAVTATLASALERPMSRIRVDLLGERLRGPEGRPRRWLGVSVQLADGRWLNASAGRPRVPPLGRAVVAALLLSAIAVAVTAALAARRLSRPLRRLADAADRLGRGEAVPALLETGPDETRRTIGAFNAMSARLDRFVRDRTTMLAAVAHDLRTPITTMRLRAEFTDDDTRARLLETLDQMQAMTDAALAFASGDAAGEPTAPTDLAALVDSVVEDLAAQGHPVTLDEGSAGHAVLPCRKLGLRRALSNLIGNAVRYGGAARVRVEAGAAIRIMVDDDGPGIPPHELDRVFEPFVRLDPSRGTAGAGVGGAGLGLSIARSTVRGHGGDVTLQNRPEGGLRAVVTLPRPTA